MINYIKNKMPWVLVRKSVYTGLVSSAKRSRIMKMRYYTELLCYTQKVLNIENYLNNLNGKTASKAVLKRILEDK